jgi:glycosyltransferase involved in cell wall biosynthesis
MRSCERLIVPCKAQKDAAINSGIDLDIEVIPLGIDPEMFPIIERKREDDGFLFGMEGTLTFRKGVDLGIKAFKLAFPKEKYPNVGFYLKSTPGIGRYYHKEAEDDERIIMTNEWFSPKELIDEFYAKIDSYVFLSRGEGMGMSTMQAMATGLPVIGSDCSGIQDHLNNNVGYLIPTTVVDVPNGTPFGYPPDLQVEGQQWWEADIEKAAEAMLDVYNNRDKANRKGKRAAEYIRRNFTADKQAERIIKYLDKKI